MATTCWATWKTTLLLSDPEFFAKILYLDRCSDGRYAFLPHRCEHIPGQGDVILSGDPDGGRPDLFWDTGETITIPWPLGDRRFYRATNPHSGCYFLSRRQALTVKRFLDSKKWKSRLESVRPPRAGWQRDALARAAIDETRSRALPLSHGAPSRQPLETSSL